MRYAIAVVVLAVLLAGCLGPGPTAPTPGPSPAPDPDKVFTGDPATLVIRLEDAPAQVMLLAAETQETDPPKQVASVRVSWQSHPFGPEEYVAYQRLELPEDAEVAITVPARPGYRVEAATFSQPDQTLLKVGQTQVDVGINMVNEATVYLETPSYTLTKPPHMYSGGGLAQWSIRSTNPLVDANVLVGLNPWSVNGTAGLYSANPNPGQAWVIFNTGHGNVPSVSEPTPLYYQVRVCTLAYLTEDRSFLCSYEPNLPDEPLDYILIYKDRDSAPNH